MTVRVLAVSISNFGVHKVRVKKTYTI